MGAVKLNCRCHTVFINIKFHCDGRQQDQYRNAVGSQSAAFLYTIDEECRIFTAARFSLQVKLSTALSALNEYLCKCCRPLALVPSPTVSIVLPPGTFVQTFNYGFSVLLHVILSSAVALCFDFKICTASNDISSAACMQFPNVNVCCNRPNGGDSIY